MKPSGKGFRLQWHITNRCNFRCKHCYHTSYDDEEELTLQELKNVFHQFLELDEDRKNISLTGGEPFLRKDFLSLLSYISKHKNNLNLDIMTNGSLLTEALLKQLKRRAPLVRKLQISVEGPEKVNDVIRSKGSFRKIFHAVKLVQNHGYPVNLAATVSKANHKKIFELLDLLLIYNVPLAIQRLVPIGNSQDKKNLLSPQELKSFYEKCRELNSDYKLKGSSNGNLKPIRISNCKHLLRYSQWPEEKQNYCAVREKKIIVVMPNGDVYPCRILPIKLGNVKKNTLKEICEGPYRQFTQKEKQALRCQKCPAYPLCEGGAPCVSYAVTGNFYARDPQCWQSFPKNNS
ncbi:MAG: radical SAM protein [Patescibacteria group bacterium]